ncbi:MAG: thymidine kinase [Chloroflexi bacterium]|nr:MAG: thymidine kinase [Chloroflexota bacterium]TMC57170.1 MAG: thymidine kinase [Chloroflexota bacterium]
MFSGKSEELIRRVKRAVIARRSVQVFKPVIDDRYGALVVRSHDGDSFIARPVRTSEEIPALVALDTSVVGIDEVQFFDPGIVHVIRSLVANGRRVICAGLDQDFRGEPFGPVPTLLALAERVEKLEAICVVCGEAATRTQRIVDGIPAFYDDPIIVVGAKEAYEARCRSCHEVPRRMPTPPSELKSSEERLRRDERVLDLE